MGTTSDFFQCVICSSFFSSVWKVEKHVKTHDDDEIQVGNGNGPEMGRRRGMLPIRKTTFFDCFVPIVKNQIDPDFLAKYDNVEAKDENIHRKSTCNRELKSLGLSDDIAEEDINGSERRPRRGNLQTKANIRRAVAAILTVPDQEEDDSDKDVIEDLLPLSEEEDIEEYEAYFCKNGRKRGRPKGSVSVNKKPKSKTSTATTKQKGRDPVTGLISDGKDHHKFKCEYCPKSFPKRKILYSHLGDKHKDVAKLIKCPVSICNYYSFYFWAMSSHIRRHCLAERKELFTEEELERLRNLEQTSSVKQNMDGGDFCCRFCLINCGGCLDDVKKHQDMKHGNEVNLNCPCCERTFEKSTWELICHVKSCHPSYLDPFNEREKNMVKYRAKQMKFECDKCDYKFRLEAQLKKHLLTHDKGNQTEKKPFQCPVCHKEFKYKDNLRRHFTLHLEKNPFVCDFPDCSRKFNSDYNLRRHKLIHSEFYVEPPRVYCPICNQSFSRKDKLPKHMREAHKPDEVVNGVPVPGSKLTHIRRSTRLPSIRYGKLIKYPVTINVEELVSSETITAPAPVPDNPIMKMEIGDEIHLVDKIILQENGTAVHVKGEHLSPQKLPTKDATKKRQPDHSKTCKDPAQLKMTSVDLSQLIAEDPAFKNLDPSCVKIKEFLTRNYHQHRGKTFTCQECKAVFSRAWSLQLHLKSIHNKTLIDESPLIAAQMRENETEETTGDGKVHSHQVTLMCSTCAYVGKNAKDLEKHMKSSHHDRRKCRCKICGITYKNDQTLQVHMKRVHNGSSSKEYRCKHCNKAFITSTAQHIHEKMVHEERPANKERVKCPICSRDYSPRSIEAHMKIHEQKTAEQLEKLKCQLCGDYFSCNSALKRHIDCVHLGKPFNKIMNRKRTETKMHAAKLTPTASVKRGPKTKGDEWFEPLLEKALNGLDTASQQIEAITTATVNAEEEDPAMSILGI